MQFEINQTQFEYKNNKLYINNRLIDCQPKLLQALLLFLKSDNQVTSKDILIFELWGEIIVSDDSLFKIIQALRKLFKQNGLDGDILVNVYGKGYKIQPTIKRIIQKTPKIVKSANYKKLITIVLAFIILISLIYIFFPNSNTESLFSQDNYKIYKQRIRHNPINTLTKLNSLEVSNNLDKLRLNFLKGYAYFNRGKYKKALTYFENVVNSKRNENDFALADTYYTLSLINLYKANDEKMLGFLNLAKKQYESLNDIEGLYAIDYRYSDYLNLTHKYQEALIGAEKLLNKSNKKNMELGKLYAHLSYSFTYMNLNQTETAKKHLKTALEIALKLGNGKYISLCYGLLAFESMDKGHYIKAMKLANQTLKYAVVQPSTNQFQQGFSYMYNILSPLGHNQLAEKYLQKAIDVQEYLNSDGHIHIAELNLAILKMKLNKHQQASALFNQLLNYNLSDIDRNSTIAWLALNSYYLEDNISAYTAAKEIYIKDGVSDKNKFIAGIALILAAVELERLPEAQTVFNEITTYINQDWLIAYDFYLKMALEIYPPSTSNHKKYLVLKQEFDSRLRKITNQTIPDTDAMKSLDDYLDVILE